MELLDLTAAPWASVAALVRVLRRQVAVQERPVEGHHLQSQCAALVLTLPTESSPPEQRGLRVALELLHTLWTLDRAAWRHVVDSVLGVDMPARLVLPDAAALTVVVSLKYDKFPRQVNRARWATLLDPHARLTEDEASVRRALVQHYALTETAMVGVPVIPLRLQFLVFGMATVSVMPYVARVVAMVENVRDLLRGAHEAEPEHLVCAPFVLDALELNLAAYEMTNGIARQVMRLHALGIRFHQLEVRIIDDDYGGEYVQDETAGRNLLLPVLLVDARDLAQAELREYSMETLVIDRADLTQFSTACTALERTRVVKNLQLQGVFTFDDPTERALKWEWLTRAIFARSSRTSIKHVSINQPEIELSDIDAVASALRATAAEANGAGDHALQTLTLGAEASEMETLEAISLLLELVGQNLEALSIYFWMGSVSSNLVQSIYRACPTLVFLDLSSVEIESMDIFLDAYELHNCQVRSLALHNVEVPNESVTAFALALCNPHRKASQVLRELCIDAVGVDNALNQANLDAFYALLFQAPASPLEYLELRVSEPLLSLNRSRFLTYHNTWGTGVAALLPGASKAAFLSACKRYGSGMDGEYVGVSPVMTQLDQHVVSLIFQFAATRAMRGVHFAEP